ncbi:MAG: nucleoside triphosphate pyrophosphohydrolase [Acidimicrobiia bacterium]
MSPRVVVVGLGPSGPDLVTDAARTAIAQIPVRFMRTTRHPSASIVVDATSFDEVYESADSLPQVYATIVDRLAVAAREHGTVLYAVPGSPLIAEHTVELLRARDDITVEIVAALSFLDVAWAALGIDPLAAGVRLVDGHRFAVEAAGERGPLLVAQCDSRDVLSDIKLSVEDGPSEPVIVLQRLGLPDQTVTSVAWDDLDRSFEPDHLTSIYVPEMAAPVGSELVGFHELVRTLRTECPWDREQTHHTLTRHLLEETYEALEAIEGLDLESGDGSEHLEEELGDVLFQVFFHSVIAAEEGWFTIADVARGINDKLVRRHPHVFADVQADDADTVVTNWEQIKKAEKNRTSLMEGIPGNLPSLLYAWKVQKKAASVGFDWLDAYGALEKVAEEADELLAADEAERAEELGDLLFSVTNVARHLGIDPEAALRAATAKFRDRFMGVEALATERGISIETAGLDVLDALWNDVKAAGTSGGT